MAEEIDNLLLEHLKALRNELRDFRNEFHTESENLRHRMSTLETAMINVKREVAAGDRTDARHQVQLDQIVERIRKVEKRLELSRAAGCLLHRPADADTKAARVCRQQRPSIVIALDLNLPEAKRQHQRIGPAGSRSGAPGGCRCGSSPPRPAATARPDTGRQPPVLPAAWGRHGLRLAIKVRLHRLLNGRWQAVPVVSAAAGQVKSKPASVLMMFDVIAAHLGGKCCNITKPNC